MMMALLQAWHDRGWLRPLDLAFARFIDQHAPGSPPELLLSAALLAHMEGLGHTCLPLDDLCRGELLLTQAEFADALREQLALMGADAAAWSSLLHGSPVVNAGDAATTGSAPMVMALGRLYLRRHWRDERQLVQSMLARTGAHHDRAGLVWGRVTPEAVRQLLDRLFGPPTAEFDWQRLACAAALRGRLTVLTGGPGTGKTYTAARLLALLLATAERPEHLRIGLAAPTGKAAARLAQSIQGAWAGLADRFGKGSGDELPMAAWAQHLGAARTLHAWLGARPDTRRWAHDEHHPLALDVLLVDEASMVHLELMAALLRALPPHALLVLLGDKDQLASVEAGAVLGDLCRGAEQGGYSAATAADLARLTGQPLPEAFLLLPPLGEGGDGGGVCARDGRWRDRAPTPALPQRGRESNAADVAASPLAQQTVMLRVSRRFGGPIGQLARQVQAGEAGPALAALRKAKPESGLHLLEAGGQASFMDDAPPAALTDRLLARALDGALGDDGQPIPGYRAVYQALQQGLQAGWPDAEAHAAWVRQVLHTFDQTRLLTALRSGPWGVAGLNTAVQAALAEARCIRPGSATASGAGWYAGRPVIVTRNDPATGVFNGDVGLALPPYLPGVGAASSDALRVWFLDGDELRSVLASRLSAVETAFAMTVHKSQGSEFAHTLLVLPERDNPVLSQELVYTGITRARRALTVVLPGPTVWPAAVQRRTRRASGLAPALAAAVDSTPAQPSWEAGGL